MLSVGGELVLEKGGEIFWRDPGGEAAFVSRRAGVGSAADACLVGCFFARAELGGGARVATTGDVY